MDRKQDNRRLFLLVLAIGLIAMSARNVVDPDVWWHLRTGQLILANHAVFHADPYSFTHAGQLWINHEWLADVLIYALYRVGSWAGLIVAFAGMTAAALVVVFLRCDASPAVAAAATVLGAIASAPSWGVRPQMISLLLASVFLWILDRASADISRSNLVWWLPPLALLWVNFHAGYLLGIGLVAIYVVGILLDVIAGMDSWTGAAPVLKKMLIAGLGCVAAAMVNPYGMKMYAYPFATLRSPAMQSSIQEWASPNFHEPKHIATLLLILAILAMLGISPRRLKPREILLLFAGIAAALMSVRHIPIFVLVATPILSGLIQGWLDQWRKLSNSQAHVFTWRKMMLNAVILVSLTGFAVGRIVYLVRRQPAEEARLFPQGAVRFLAQNDVPGPIFNHYDWGGYLIWKLYPRYKVFIDGRADVYGEQGMQEFGHAYYLTDDWQGPLDDWRIRSVLLPQDSPLATALEARGGWDKVYADWQAVILTRVP